MLKSKISAYLIVINTLVGLSIASASFAATPPSKPGCSDGWVPAPNPQLGCIPNRIKAPELRQTIKKNPASITICPEGSVLAAPPLNPQLGCLPNRVKAPGLNQPIQKTTPSQQIKIPQ